MKSVRILGARFDPDINRIEVVKSITNDDGTEELNLHSISVDTLEWKAAECRNTNDINMLIDVILYEPFFDQVDTKDIIDKAIEAKVKFADVRKLNKLDAKGQLNRSGVHPKYIDSVDNDVYEIISDNSNFDLDIIRTKVEYLERSKTSQVKLEVPDRAQTINRALKRSDTNDRGTRGSQQSRPTISKELKTVKLSKGGRVK